MKTKDGHTVRMKVGFTPVLNTSGRKAPVTPVVRAGEAKGTV